VVQSRGQSPEVVELAERSGGGAADADRGVDVAGLHRGLHPDEPDDREPPRVTVAVELFLRRGQQSP
jgi:hypothetical protein